MVFACALPRVVPVDRGQVAIFIVKFACARCMQESW